MDKKQESVFAEGIYLNRVSPNAPAFIITNQSIHIEKAIAWLNSVKHLADAKGYIRLVGKESKAVNEQGIPKRYFQVDTWKPSEAAQTPADEDVPFE